MSNLTLFRHPLSGHSHRAELFLSILGLEANIVDVDLMSGEQKSAGFLEKNPLGQVPVLVNGDTTLADSNAILVYLARLYDKSGTWLPDTPVEAAAVQRFLSIAAGEINNGPGAARLVTLFGADRNHEQVKAAAHAILTMLDHHLDSRDWLVSTHPTIADLANYAYVAHAPEGDVSLRDYVNIGKWLARIEALPGFVPMHASAVGLAA